MAACWWRVARAALIICGSDGGGHFTERVGAFASGGAARELTLPQNPNAPKRTSSAQGEGVS